jgi:hypothetical protein
VTKISQLSSIGDSLSVDDQFIIRDVSDVSTPNKSVTVSGITRALDLGTAAAPAIAFASDKNTGIYSPGADQVAISTNSSQRLVVDSSGRVGIGTSSPSVRLQVTDSIAGGSDNTIATLHNFSDTGGDTRYAGLNFRIGSDNGTSAIRAGRTLSSVDYRTDLSFWTNPTGATQTPVRAMTIDYLQRVGIGTTSPSSPLHIYSVGSTEILIGGTATPILNLIGGATTDPVIGYGVGALRFGTTTGAGAAGFSEKARIDSSGNMGIGTSSPVHSLQVKSGAAAGTLSLSGGSEITGGPSSILMGNNDSGGIAGPFVIRSANRELLFGVGSSFTANGGGTFTEHARLDSSGRVGIGTSSPTALLEVGIGSPTVPAAKSVFNTGNTTDVGILVSNWTGSATTNGPRIAFGNSGRGTFNIGGGNGVNSFVIRDVQAASDRLTIDSSGRLLVGTSADSGGALLQVNGDRIRIGTAKTPTSATDTGTAGEICWDASYVYVCTATNTWKRSAISTW